MGYPHDLENLHLFVHSPAFIIQLSTFQRRTAGRLHIEPLPHEGGAAVEALTLETVAIVAGPVALIAIHFVPESCGQGWPGVKNMATVGEKNGQ